MFDCIKSCSRGLKYQKCHKLYSISILFPSPYSQKAVCAVNCGPTGQEGTVGLGSRLSLIYCIVIFNICRQILGPGQHFINLVPGGSFRAAKAAGKCHWPPNSTYPRGGALLPRPLYPFMVLYLYLQFP
jgi:hypothetical protein